MNIAQIMDHTLLKATATEEEIKQICREAIEYNFKTVCVPPCYVPVASHLLEETGVGITTVVGFPLGNETSATKAFQAKEAILNGASDIDMVINVGALKDEKYDYVQFDIEEVVKVSKATDAHTIVKVILETCYLTDEEIKIACQLAVKAGADFVKTSTGFGTGGATTHHVALMKEAVGDKAQVKASGGISNRVTAEAMVQSGATRLGVSKSIAIVEGQDVSSDGNY